MAKKEKGEKKKGSCLMTFLVSVLIVLALAIVVPLIVIGTGDTKKKKETQKNKWQKKKLMPMVGRKMTKLILKQL